MFSGLNNLEDISMNKKYSAILGITEQELKDSFREYIKAFSEELKISEGALMEKIRGWYNGYCFAAGGETVYNPFSTLLLFKHQEFRSFWFETGTPSFLIELAKKNEFEIAELPLEISELSFTAYDVEQMQTVPLLFQTGYLTLKGYDPESMLYTLDYPNFEVKNSFLSHFTTSWTGRQAPESYINKLIVSLRSKDFEKFFTVLRSLFASVSYDLHIPQEKYYQTLFYLIFTMIGLRVTAEVRTNVGRIDAVIEDKDTYIFEFKFNGTAEEGLAQIRKNKYFEKYISEKNSLYLFGAEFKDRNIGEWIMGS